VIGKAIESDDYTGLTRIAYAVYFTKGNLYVNFIAVGLERQIDDEKVIALAQKIAQRIV